MTVEGSGTLVVPARFNGPLDSGNGGYSCGIFAATVAGAAEVSLRSPVPLDTELRLEREGATVRVLDGETLIAEAEPGSAVEAAVPATVGVEEARRAAARYRGEAGGLFSRCFVCGLDREDSLGVFAGEVEGGGLVASPWTPPEWAANEDGEVRPEVVWAVLDCPTFFAVHLGERPTLSFLARQGVQIHGRIRAGEQHVVIAWPIETDGRKRRAGAALVSAAGEVLASGRALMIEAQPS